MPTPTTSATTGRATVDAMIRVLRALHDHLGEQVDDKASYVLLHHVAESGPVRVTDLSALVGLDHSTVSRHVARLLDAGRVVREPDPDDRRAWRLSLTDAGAALLDAAHRRRATEVDAATSQWPAADRAQLVRLLGTLADDLDRLHRSEREDLP